MDTVLSSDAGHSVTCEAPPAQTLTVVVTDSRALIWSTTHQDRKLGKRARDLFSRAEQGLAVIYVPAIALVEVAEVVHRGAIQFDLGFTRWVDRLFRSSHFLPADLTPEIVLKAEELYAIPERGDRLIAATAAHLELPLITNDPAIEGTPGLTTIW